METYYLREFIALASLKSFTKVADELNTTASSASRHLQALENELGAVLVNRGTKGVELTKAGETLLFYAEKIVRSQESCIHELEHEKIREKNTLRIASSVPQTAQIISAFYAKNPEIILDYREYEEELLLEILSLGECDIGFGLLDIVPAKDYICIPYAQLEYIVGLAPNNPLSARSSLTINDLTDETLVVESLHSPITDRILKYMEGEHLVPRQIMQVSTAAKTFIANGIGIEINAEFPWSQRALSNSVVSKIPLYPSPQLDLCMFYRKSYRLAPAAQKLVEFINTDWNLTRQRFRK